MTRDYDLSTRAIRDIAKVRDWYDRHRQSLGDRFLDAVLRAIRSAREHAERYPEVEPGVRGVPCRRFPYRVYYEVLQDRIIVRAVYHTARDPELWDDEDRD